MGETFEKNMRKFLNEEYDRIIELEEKLQPVRDLIKQKKYKEATKVCSDIFMTVDPNFLYRNKYIISKMGELEPDEFDRWLHNPIPFEHYPYSEYYGYDERERQPLQLPMVLADERLYNTKVYKPIEGSIEDE